MLQRHGQLLRWYRYTPWLSCMLVPRLFPRRPQLGTSRFGGEAARAPRAANGSDSQPGIVREIAPRCGEYTYTCPWLQRASMHGSRTELRAGRRH